MLQFETVLSTSYYFEKDNLLFIKLKEEAELTVDNIIVHNEQTLKLLGEKACKVIFDVRHLQFTHISRDVLEYIANSPYNKYQLSEAFIISGLGQKLIANFYLQVVKPKIKSKVFTGIQSALEWQGIENKDHFISLFNEGSPTF